MVGDQLRTGRRHLQHFIATSGPSRVAAARVAGKWMQRHKPGLVTAVSPLDEMYHGLAAMTYFAVGSDALSVIRQSILLGGGSEPQSILDLPCGFGRVLRWLRAEWPQAQITACDLNRAAVEWCSRHLGAQPLYSVPMIESLDLGGPYDVVWVGSLLTHLDCDRWYPTLEALTSGLRAGGVLVFTTHGQEHWQRLTQFPAGLDEAGRAKVLDGWSQAGFGYADYPAGAGYGISLSRPDWVRSVMSRVPDVEELALWIAGWNHHQDVYAYRKVR